MTAVAIWYVLCDADPRSAKCWWKTDDEETKADAQRLARKEGWLVGKRNGDPNLCPECRLSTDGVAR